MRYNTTGIVPSLSFQRPLKASTENRPLKGREFAEDLRTSGVPVDVLRNSADPLEPKSNNGAALDSAEYYLQQLAAPSAHSKSQFSGESGTNSVQRPIPWRDLKLERRVTLPSLAGIFGIGTTIEQVIAGKLAAAILERRMRIHRVLMPFREAPEQGTQEYRRWKRLVHGPGGEGIPHQELKAAGALWLQSIGSEHIEFEAPCCSYGRGDVYSHDFDIAIECGTTPIERVWCVLKGEHRAFVQMPYDRVDGALTAAYLFTATKSGLSHQFILPGVQRCN